MHYSEIGQKILASFRSKMASLLQNFEQQYSAVTADITFNIGRISNTTGGKTSTHHLVIHECSHLVDHHRRQIVLRMSKGLAVLNSSAIVSLMEAAFCHGRISSGKDDGSGKADSNE